MPTLEHVEVRGTNLDTLVKKSSFDYTALTLLVTRSLPARRFAVKGDVVVRNALAERRLGRNLTLIHVFTYFGHAHSEYKNAGEQKIRREKSVTCARSFLARRPIRN